MKTQIFGSIYILILFYNNIETLGFSYFLIYFFDTLAAL